MLGGSSNPLPSLHTCNTPVLLGLPWLLQLARGSASLTAHPDQSQLPRVHKPPPTLPPGAAAGAWQHPEHGSRGGHPSLGGAGSGGPAAARRSGYSSGAGAGHLGECSPKATLATRAGKTCVFLCVRGEGVKVGALQSWHTACTMPCMPPLFSHFYLKSKPSICRPSTATTHATPTAGGVPRAPHAAAGAAAAGFSNRPGAVHAAARRHHHHKRACGGACSPTPRPKPPTFNL